DALWVGAAVFLVTYALISIRRFPHIRIDRPAAALLGAGLMLVFGVVSPQEAIDAISVDIVLLLVGMMLLAAGLELCGFFEWVSLRMIKHSRNQFQLLALTMVVTGGLSALVLNDTVVLLFTPIIIRTCRLLKSNPVPFLIAEAIAANIGSVATAVGNPQNAYIATKAGISFVDFPARLLPVSLVCMGVAILMLFLFFRKDLETSSSREVRKEIAELGWEEFQKKVLGSNSHSGASMERMDSRRTGLIVLLGITCVTFMAFVASHVIGTPVAIVAFVAGTVAVFALPIVSEVKAKDMLAGVDWSIILFFVGLFVVIAGVRTSGLLDEMSRLFPGFGDGSVPTPAWLTALSAVLANLVSNVPSVMLLSEMLPITQTDLYLVLASSSTLAGNATILGAAANVIVAEKAEAMGVEVGFWRFTLIGFPVAMVTLFVSTLLLSILL
ncbi:TPA: arsenic ABC transporter, partial [Thermoplasmata archaeon]|nr:arsenic ABC transporter [Thermoplasmata archaeon]